MKDPALTPLGVMVLALLSEGDMHPYEMARLLRARRDDRIIPISHGTLYHTVSRLHGQGLLEEVGVDRDGNRPERTTYAVTPAGADAVREWVRRELGGSRRQTPFRVALAEAHNLDRDEAVDLLTQRLALLREELETLDGVLDGAETREVPEQYLLEPFRHRLMLQAEIDWLGTLIPRIASSDFSWGPDPDHLLAKRKAHQNG
ncbi:MULTISPECIES: PadR family transcriptional regulator [unclassified Microbacterium]|uniref:PadR family transcriptional regulator n=1 Tax=unclassified Microbacterium TaxID=2609290 RepID=UPI00364DEEF1